jgi:KDO2-lipid IV(A) lauroyltransferase
MLKQRIQFIFQAILLLPFLGVLSILPYFLIYIFSDGLFILVFYVLKYRRTIVEDNLKQAFPGKSQNELYEIEKRFYHHLCDMIMETIKLLSVSRNTLNSRCYISEQDNIYPELYAKYGSVISALGHYGNWEMICQASTNMAPHRILVIYKPVSNLFFDWFFKYIRTRTGAEVVSMRDAYRKFMFLKGEKIMPVMLSDQSPSEMNGAIWLSFMGRNTPVMNGIARISKKMELPIVVNKVVKVKRGIYKIVPQLLVAHPGHFSEEEITAMHVQWLESEIRENPEWWLWSHRRWKHSN